MEGKLRLTHHAVDRYVERLRPALDDRCARLELERLARIGTVSLAAPAWYPHGKPCDGFLLLGDDVAIPLGRLRDGEYLALTVIDRGRLTTGQRQHRNRLAQKRRALRRARRMKPRRDARPLLAPEPLATALAVYA